MQDRNMGNAATASRRAGEGGRIGGVPLNLLKPKSGAIAPLLDSNRLGSYLSIRKGSGRKDGQPAMCGPWGTQEDFFLLVSTLMS